jgi:hypothetical protein
MASPGVVAAAFVVAALAAFCGTDPLRWGSMVDFPGFEVHPVDLPAADEMPLHADAAERLRGEVQGPESVAFDPRGRGPYTGVADGRVVVWDGARWATFATTSPRWSQEVCGGPKASLLEYHTSAAAPSGSVSTSALGTSTSPTLTSACSRLAPRAGWPRRSPRRPRACA